MLELLSPAGDYERLIMALHYGADAVYAGGSGYNMRAAAANFSSGEMSEAVELAHKYGAKFYATCNTIVHNEELKELPAYLSGLERIGVDAIITADTGVFMLSRKHAPNTPIHISTQAGVCNYAAARFWHEQGASRIILARELSLSQIAELREKIPLQLELEVFVHGAMCVSFSGRCLLSSYMTGRDANRGECAQPCRWKYSLVEEKRPGEYMPVYEQAEEEEEKGTYILNANDLCMVEHIGDLYNCGVTSLKIEGRMKSAYYTAVVTNAYRHAINDFFKGEKFDPYWLDELGKVSHRRYGTGFYYGMPKKAQNYSSSSYIRDYDIIAVVEDYDSREDVIICSQRNRFFPGETAELMSRNQKAQEFVIESVTDIQDNILETANRTMQMLKIKARGIITAKYDIIRRRN